jgi:hypothetical protein
MTIGLYLILASIVFLLGIEMWLRLKRPNLLWRTQFREKLAVQPHPTRGWNQKPHADFEYVHRYLSRSNRVHFNSLGMHDINEYDEEKSDNCIRIALYGDTTVAGYELPIDETIASNLRRNIEQAYPGKRIEVMNAATRNYCTAQLYQWHKEELFKFQPDIVVYLFVSNHPRRNITFHESGKSSVLTRPVLYAGDNEEFRLIHSIPDEHPNDLVVLNSKGNIEYKRGNTSNSLYTRILNRSYLLNFVEDLSMGDKRQRKYKDRTEIKDLEKKEKVQIENGEVLVLPYQWLLTQKILRQWVIEVHNSGGQFVVAPFLTAYHADRGRLYAQDGHPLGFDFDKIPERIALPKLSEEIGFEYFDSYAQVLNNRINTSPFYIHPRYGYPTIEGARFYADFLAESLKDKLLNTYNITSNK